MGKDRSSMDSTVGNNRSMDSMSNRGMGNNRSMDSMGNRGMSNNRGMGNSMSSRVGRSTIIGDFSNKSKVIVSMVGSGLKSAIRKSNRVRSSNISIGILGFSLSEVGSTVVIIYSILIAEGFRGLIIGGRGRGILGGREGGSSGHKSRGKDNLVHVNGWIVGEELPC